MRRVLLAAGAAVLALVPAASASAATQCSRSASAADAAKDLYGAGTELVRTGRVAGLRTALALEPRIAPGTRRRMVRNDGGWCDAATGFNRAWSRKGDGAATAAAFASVAAAPYFDGVTVQDVQRSALGTYVVRTHARTNGVEARWVITTDASGVRNATWTATRFGVKPLVAEIEGLTAFPGGTETYTRTASGLLAEKRGLPTAAGARRASSGRSGIPAVYTGPDGMQIRLSVGDSRVAVDPGVRTGIDRADVQQNFMDAIELNYEEFHDWGLRKGWESDLDPVLGPNVGWVYVNDALSLYCLACVFIADDFQIHMSSEVTVALAALGFDGYGDSPEDQRKAFLNVVGHEMFHNFQNAYNNPGPLGRPAGRGVSTAYSEGTARFQETLHSYSDVSYKNKTLVTGGQQNPPRLSLDANHCNGYKGSATASDATIETAFAAGPFPKTYNACLFWTSWFNQNGSDAFIRLVTQSFPANSPKPSVAEGVAAIAHAGGKSSVAEQLAFFAQSALTGRNRTITQLSGDPITRDWGKFFFKWAPATLERGQDATQSIGGAGIFARRLNASATVSLTDTDPKNDLAFYLVRSKHGRSLVTRLDPAGTPVDIAPVGGRETWVVAVNPTAETISGTLKAR